MICLLSWLLFLISTASAIKFSVYAGVPNAPPYCVRDFVFKDALVVINGEITGKNLEGQHVTIFVTDDKANEYSRKKDVKDNFHVVFTSHTDATIDICFENVASNNHVYDSHVDVKLDVEIGVSARDWNAIRVQDKLKPSEVELKRVQELTEELSKELDYLKKREARLRDTNESTNGRVKVFSLGVIASLISLGIWQILYLRAYFRSKHII